MTHYITTLLDDANALTQSVGVEFEGVWVTDPTMSQCGRFQLSKADSLVTYDITPEQHDQMVACSNIKWTDFSYNNDTSDSIGYTFDNDKDMYVQLFAFETKADAERENLPMYGITACEDGLTRYDCWTGDDRSEALSEALRQACEMYRKHTK
jgi:hypothetical protein